MTGPFPSATLTRYLLKLFFVRFLAVLLVMLILLLVLNMLSESDKILAAPGNTQDDVWTYAAYRAPQLAKFLTPFCVLLATLITLSTLNANSEVISMKAAGLSAHQILSPLFLAAGVVAVSAFAFNELVATRATAQLSAWESTGFRTLPTGSEPQSNVWVRDGDDLIHAEVVTQNRDGLTLAGVSIYERDGGRMIATITAPSAQVPASGGIQLRDARRFDVASGALSTQPAMTTSANVRADQFTLANVKPDATRVDRLRAQIGLLERAGRPVQALEAAWWHKFAAPLSTLLMPLLGAVAGFGLARSGKLFVRAVIGMALGFAYFVADNFALAMGNIGSYPPIIAAWGPVVLFAMIGEFVLVRTEE